MNGEEVATAVAHLVVATPGWTHEAADEYMAQLVELDDAEALDRACRSIARAWAENRRPPLAIVIDSYDREVRLSTKAIDPARVHCDGSHFRRQAGALVPCARCNPALTRVWADPATFREWLHGVETETLDVGVEKINGRLRYSDGTRPATCYPVDEEPAALDTVRDLMWLGYSQQVSEEGRKPNRRHFDDLTRKALT